MTGSICKPGVSDLAGGWAHTVEAYVFTFGWTLALTVVLERHVCAQITPMQEPARRLNGGDQWRVPPSRHLLIST